MIELDPSWPGVEIHPWVASALCALRPGAQGLTVAPEATAGLVAEADAVRSGPELLRLVDDGLRLAAVLAEERRSPGAAEVIVSLLAPAAARLHAVAAADAAAGAAREGRARRAAQRQQPAVRGASVDLPSPRPPSRSRS